MKALAATTSMGPGIKLDPSKTRDLIEDEGNVAEGAAAAALT